MWPLIPPQYIGWSFHGSRFPSYHDDEFDTFREFGSAIRRAFEDGDRCDVHGRFLSRPEYQAGGCFWCKPWLDKRRKTDQGHHAAERPSDDDGILEVTEVLQARF